MMSPSPEPRWPAIIALVGVYLLIADLPDHVRLMPHWVSAAATALAILPMALLVFGGPTAPRLRAERGAVIAVAALVLVYAVTMLAVLIANIVAGSSPLSGLRLLSSSVVVWVCNIVGFGLLYWQVDGGGPAGRARRHRPDWLFPQAGAGAAVESGWRPVFVDYLYLAFSTATAFSTTDASPLTPRAKLLMMSEAAISLVTMVVVASRAINVLAN
ncbi:DUF1345 domain-containing protein [Neoroseomonas oryzicola]|uniref:DUF1345 domain-containing protein n=2 Tax=Neoroseomonas oryzicola TaxID=535904 RepID=A0ABX1EGB9_9PROT|nr:DUF1345 domain-containing protein [Neoroseomonas oryzicola]NKE16841.1 DUF1345 domain-containing protein [Neoroseomonas oryzicola]